jgi:Protein of unknown function (DUF3995)
MGTASRAGRLAAVLAFASAAVSLYWLLGGTALLDTVGGDLERLARERSTGALAGLAVVVVLKGAAGVLALRAGRGGWERRLGWLVAVVLIAYGGLLVVVGLAVLVFDPGAADDPHALRWHVACWDLWFLVWGLAHAAALRRSRSRSRR